MPVGTAASGVLAEEGGVAEQSMLGSQPETRDDWRGKPEDKLVQRSVPASATVRRPAPSVVAGGRRRAAPHVQVRHGFADSIADYRYVAGDLRRIGILAGSLVVLLIVLSFVVPLVSH
jgi:hypothetical protein